MKQHYCLLERFNNYFNRKIIKYESLSDYEDHAKDSFIPYNEDGSMTLFDFNPADNVTTEIIVNNVPFDPDYFLLLDDNAQIVQRWFVLEQKRNRQGQWVYYLRRDVVADNFNNLLNAPIFVQKGMLHDNDPFIFNSEGMSFNQIKKSETLLKDQSKTAWIVCYLAKSLNASDISVNVSSEEIIPEYFTLAQIASELGVSEAVLIDLLNIQQGDNKTVNSTARAELNYIYKARFNSYYNIEYEFSSTFATLIDKTRTARSGIYNNYLFDDPGVEEIWTSNKFETNVINEREGIISEMPNILERTYYILQSKMTEAINKYNGKVVSYLGNFYTLNFVSQGSTTTNKTFKPSNYYYWNNVCLNTERSIGPLEYNNTNGEATLNLIENSYKLNLESYPLTTKTYGTVISSSRRVCSKQAYDIVAIPVDVQFILSGGTTISQPLDIAQQIASALAVQEATNVYDVQLLPFCPRPDMIYDDGIINLADYSENVDFSYIKITEGGTSTNIGAILYCDSASFSNRLYYSLNLTDSVKIDSQCNFYRLVSPNYQGGFEFNVARNGGNVEWFNLYCTYKPYTPFIKVTPELNNLYGKDFNDNRGLICGGDYSLSRFSSAWEQYQLENKNYQNIFNREMQNMNFMQSIEMRNQLVSGAVGIVSDTVKGAGAGAFGGGGIAGAVTGGILGGATSAVGFAIDVDTLAKTQRETKQLAIDKFNYQLGNIKALPYTLTKVGAFDISSKIFPFLEYYTCTDKEKDALREKIKYESMTVMRIGTINEFKDFDGKKNYFKGELIRNDEIADDSHILNAIYEELLKGVYI